MLEALPEEDRRRVLAACRRRRFAQKEIIFHDGDPGDTLHLIDRGDVAVRVTTPFGDVATLAATAQALGPARAAGAVTPDP